MVGSVYGRVIRADGSVRELGLLGRKIVTSVGANAVAAAFAGTALPSFKYHALGFGTIPETINDTALADEVTPVNRGTGSQASLTNTYTTVGTVTMTTTGIVSEWGLFSAPTGGILFDRQTFTGIALESTDSLQITYVLTVNAGG